MSDTDPGPVQHPGPDGDDLREASPAGEGEGEAVDALPRRLLVWMLPFASCS